MTENKALSISFITNNFYEILDYEFHRAARYKNVVTLMFIKIGHLDKISRNYGQLAAASILWEIERLIRDNIRHADREFIYGNDEFMIILPHTAKEGANRMVSKLKRLIEGYPFTNGKESGVSLTPKFGIASYPHDVQTKDGVVKLANNIM